MKHALLFLWTLPSLVASYQHYPPPQDPPIMRAWSCHGRSQRELVNNLATAQIIRSPIVKKVMTLVDRANYVNQRPYDDTPQSIGT
jgi:protein-L-isoaspartate(D-aspartate) O-methyltransferase